MGKPLHSIQSQSKSWTIHREAILRYYPESTSCAVSKDKWDTKEDTTKSTEPFEYHMNTYYIQLWVCIYNAGIRIGNISLFTGFAR